MKHILLSLLLIFFGMNLLGVPDAGIEEAVIIHLDGLTEEQNVEIFEFFQKDSKVKVVNTCQLLGIIVFDSKSKSGLTLLEVEAYVQAKLNSLAKDQSISVIKGMTKDQVNIDCRKAVVEKNFSSK